MKVISKSVVLSGSLYYRRHLELINPMLPRRLTEGEINVLSEFMFLNNVDDKFDKVGRKAVMDKLGLSFSGLTNYLSSLRKKGFIIKNAKGSYDIVPILLCDNDKMVYNFKIENYEEQGKN
mgnify:FL=1|jgi:hypothetical protein